MSVLSGMEKFSHLEDKIYLTIEYAKKLRDEKERLEAEAEALRQDAARAIADRNAIEGKVSVLLSERDSIRSKVDAMLEALADIDPAAVESARR